MSRVLVVADDPWVVSEVHAALSIGTNELIDHSDPSTAAVATGDESVDVAVVDLQVASMGGMAITRSIRDLREPVPVVLLLDREADTFLAGRSGATCLGRQAVHDFCPSNRRFGRFWRSVTEPAEPPSTNTAGVPR